VSQCDHTVDAVKVENIPRVELFAKVNAETISRKRNRSVEPWVTNDCIVDYRGNGVFGGRPRRDSEVFLNREPVGGGKTLSGAGFGKNFGNPASPSRPREADVEY
jgi:hypothetical protein